MSEKTFSTIAGASLLLVAFNMVGKGLGFIREIVFANYYGLTKDFDIYLIGAVIPVVLNSIILFIGQNFFIPSYQKISIGNKAEGKKFFTISLILFTLFGSLLTVGIFFCSEQFVGFFIRNLIEQKTIAIKIFQLSLLTLPFNSAIAILIAFLQAEFEFKSSVISYLFPNVVIIVMVFFFIHLFGIFAIPIGTLTGTILQFGYLVYIVNHKKTFARFDKSILVNVIKNFGGFLGFTILIEIMGQFFVLIDRYFYSSVPQGSIAALNYAFNVFVLPITIFTFAFSTVIFPKFSFHSSKDNLFKQFVKALNINTFIALPITLIFLFYGDVLIQLFFQRGNFQFSDTEKTFTLLKIFSLSLVFYSGYAILNKLIYSIGKLKMLAVIQVSAILLKLILNFSFVNTYAQNGLALSSAISFIFFFVSGILVVKRYFKGMIFQETILEFGLNLLNGVFSYLLVWFIFTIGKINWEYETIIKISLFVCIYILNSKVIKQNTYNLLEENIILLKGLIVDKK
ncbi:MAG: polysaccharide biosynthesis C-terminal domain-containing protein [Ignavibacteriaceae bacterium]|nr:polysaccharide biosynthesis C-terminal domain-containing protein [Ignavibacteriaceae bacterium]